MTAALVEGEWSAARPVVVVVVVVVILGVGVNTPLMFSFRAVEQIFYAEI